MSSCECSSRRGYRRGSSTSYTEMANSSQILLCSIVISLGYHSPAPQQYSVAFTGNPLRTWKRTVPSPAWLAKPVARTLWSYTQPQILTPTIARSFEVHLNFKDKNVRPHQELTTQNHCVLSSKNA